MSVTTVVTGATGGIGKEIVRGLMRKGVAIVIGLRNVDKGGALSADLSGEPGGGKIEVLPLDIASMESVRKFAVAV